MEVEFTTSNNIGILWSKYLILKKAEETFFYILLSFTSLLVSPLLLQRHQPVVEFFYFFPTDNERLIYFFPSVEMFLTVSLYIILKITQSEE